METLLIVNSLLLGVCVYFIRDFHADFKATAETVNSLKTKVNEISIKVDIQSKSTERRLDKLEEEK